MKLNKTIYYLTEQDKVVDFNIKKRKIDDKYKYLNNNPIYKFFSKLTYRLIATPIAFINVKLINKVKVHNKHLLNQLKQDGCFIYANHTNQFVDGFAPGIICYPHKPHFIVDSDNVSIPVVGNFVKMWGAMPIPETVNATKNLYSAIESILKHKNPIVIYPESQLWPYHTKIRDFPSTSFSFPVKYNKPVFTFTTVYKKKHKSKKPKIEIYIDGPFYPQTNIHPKIAQQNLKDIVYNKMKERSNLNDCEYIKYIKKEQI